MGSLRLALLASLRDASGDAPPQTVSPGMKKQKIKAESLDDTAALGSPETKPLMDDNVAEKGAQGKLNKHSWPKRRGRLPKAMFELGGSSSSAGATKGQSTSLASRDPSSDRDTVKKTGASGSSQPSSVGGRSNSDDENSDDDDDDDDDEPISSIVPRVLIEQRATAEKRKRQKPLFIKREESPSRQSSMDKTALAPFDDDNKPSVEKQPAAPVPRAATEDAEEPPAKKMAVAEPAASKLAASKPATPKLAMPKAVAPKATAAEEPSMADRAATGTATEKSAAADKVAPSVDEAAKTASKGLKPTLKPTSSSSSPPPPPPPPSSSRATADKPSLSSSSSKEGSAAEAPGKTMGTLSAAAMATTAMAMATSPAKKALAPAKAKGPEPKKASSALDAAATASTTNKATASSGKGTSNVVPLLLTDKAPAKVPRAAEVKESAPAAASGEKKTAPVVVEKTSTAKKADEASKATDEAAKEAVVEDRPSTKAAVTTEKAASSSLTLSDGKEDATKASKKTMPKPENENTRSSENSVERAVVRTQPMETDDDLAMVAAKEEEDGDHDDNDGDGDEGEEAAEEEDNDDDDDDDRDAQKEASSLASAAAAAAMKKKSSKKRARMTDASLALAAGDASYSADDVRRPGRAAAKEATRRIMNREYQQVDSLQPLMKKARPDDGGPPPQQAPEAKAPAASPRQRGGAASSSSLSLSWSLAAPAALAPVIDEPEEQWAQCDRCTKWRRLPATVDVDALPERWFCEMNVWSPARANCETPDDQLLEEPALKAAAEASALAEAPPAAAGAAAPATASSSSSSSSPPPALEYASVAPPPPPEEATDPLAAAAAAAVQASSSAGAASEAPSSPKQAGKSAFQWVQCDRCQKWRRVPGNIDTSQLPEHWFCEMNRWDTNRAECAVPEEAEDEAESIENKPGGSRSAQRRAGRPPASGSRSGARKTTRAPVGRPPTGGESAEAVGEAATAAASAPEEAAAAAATTTTTTQPKKPVWNWVQCERRTCRKWRRLPLKISLKSLPDKWVCSLNTWDYRFASCLADEEDADEVEKEDQQQVASFALGGHQGAHQGKRAGGKLSFREIIFNQDGKFRPPFSERSTVTSIFSVGTTLEHGKLRDVPAYADSPVYFDAPTYPPNSKGTEPRTTERCLL